MPLRSQGRSSDHKVPTYTHHTGCSISGGVVLVIDRRSGLGYIEKQVAGNDNDVTGLPIIHMHYSIHAILQRLGWLRGKNFNYLPVACGCV